MSFIFKNLRDIERKRLKSLVTMAMAWRYGDDIREAVGSLIEALICWINGQYGEGVGETWIDECIAEVEEEKRMCREKIREKREGIESVK